MNDIRRFGRPREHDRLAIAYKLIEWAKLPDSINLNKFCTNTCNPPISPQNITLWASECEHFREAYEIAKGFIASRREEWLHSELLHVKAYDLNASFYDHFIKQEKLFMEKYKSELGTLALASAPNQNAIDYAALMMRQKNEYEALKIENEQLKAQLNGSKPEASQELLRSDTPL